jgi:hypothetical protein
VADGAGARVVVIPKKQKNTFGRAGSITSILTAKYSLNSTQNLTQAAIRKEGFEEGGPSFQLPPALRGATILGHGHKLSYQPATLNSANRYVSISLSLSLSLFSLSLSLSLSRYIYICLTYSTTNTTCGTVSLCLPPPI